jgi:hypothetical protein
MACWMAPSVAADIWGMSVEQVMAGVADGSIPSRLEGNFLFVGMNTQSASEASTQEQSDEESIEERTGNDKDVSEWRSARHRAALHRRPPQAA